MKFTKILAGMFLFFSLLVPTVTFAQAFPGATPPFVGGTTGGGDSIQDGLDQVPPELKGGRFGNANSVTDVIVIIIYIILGIAGAVAVLFVVLGGFWYLTAGGSDTQVKKGKAFLLNAMIGIVIILLSYVVVNVVVNQLTRY